MSPIGPESDIQVIARCLLSTREGDQISSADAQRLEDIANHGYSMDHSEGQPRPTTTMPEARRSGSRPLGAAGPEGFVP